MVRFQDSILDRLHHHTFSNMLSNMIFEAHHAWILSCSSPRPHAWFTIRPIFLNFWLTSPVFSIALQIWFGLPHPSIVSILDACAHIPLTLWVSTSYIMFMATNAQEPMIQFTTPLLPLSEMLASMWGENNYMCFLQTRSIPFVDELTLCSPKMAFAP
jgi:hypothetical protein